MYFMHLGLHEYNTCTTNNILPFLPKMSFLFINDKVMVFHNRVEKEAI